jgi:hypothetical protein
VRWLSCGKVSERFVGYFDASRPFCPQLEDEQWVVKLMFLTDITDSMSSISDCKVQGLLFWTCATHGRLLLAVFSSDIATSTFRYFRHLRELSSQCNISNAEICAYMRKLESEFTTRFGDFKGPMTCYFMYSLI